MDGNSVDYNRLREVYTYKQFRASMLGKSEAQIYNYLTSNDDISPNSILARSATAGTALHRLVQAQQFKAGNISSAEHFVYSPDYNITGHIDAISKNLGIGDIKTVSQKVFQRLNRFGPNPAHVSQVNFYLRAMGKDEGYIQYLLREDPSKQRVFHLKYDPELFKSDVAKLNRVRARIEAELSTGTLRKEGLKMGASLETLREEAANPVPKLEQDAARMEELIEDFQKKQQQLRLTRLSSNKARNRLPGREDYNTIRGMKHGWFGRQRKQTTDFGSSYRINSNFIEKYFTGQFGLDIETMGVKATPESILQIGIQRPSGKLYEINVQQQTGFQVPHFHKEVGGLGDYYKTLDITKQQPFHKTIDEEQRRVYRTIASREKAEVLSRNMLRSGTPANVIIHNANFEIRHFRSWMGVDKVPFNFSEEYWDLIKGNNTARFEESRQTILGLLSPEKARTNDINRQVNVYRQILKDARRGRSIIDTMELAKTMNALAMQKGLIPTTGELALGTNVEFLAKTILGKEEFHRAAQDVALQNALAPKLVKYIEEIQAGRTPEELKGWIAEWQDPRRLKVRAQRKAIESGIESLAAKGYHEVGSFSKYGKKVHSYDELLEYLGKYGKYKQAGITQGRRVSAFNLKEIVEEAQKGIGKYHQDLLKVQKARQPVQQRLIGIAKAAGIDKYTKLAAVGGLALAGFAAYNLFSGRDDDYNTIEGLRHGWFGESRKYLTDFGSGWKRPDERPEPQDPTPFWWSGLAATTAATAGAAFLWKKPAGLGAFRFNINNMPYLGPVPEGITRAKFLGRTHATYGDILYSGIRRLELGFGGIPKAFSVSTLLSPSILRDATYSVELGLKKSTLSAGTTAYTRYLESLVGVEPGELIKSGVEEVTYKKGQLIATKGRRSGDVLLKYARLFQRIHEPRVVKSAAQLAKSYENIIAPTGVGKEFEFLMGGGKTRTSAMLRTAHAYGHESFAKYLRLLDDPVKFAREFLELPESPFLKKLGAVSKKIPGFGVGGEKKLVGGLPTLLLRHAKKALPLLIGIPFTYGMADWAARQIAPEDTVMGKAGITGLGAETVRLAHMTHGRVSEAAGLTQIRQWAEEQAPGMTGVGPALGLTLSGALTGMFSGFVTGLGRELGAPDKFEQFIANKKATQQMPGFLKRIPGMKGAYGLVGRHMRAGAAIGAAAALPFFLLGLGAEKTPEELEAEYSGEKEVPIRKGRLWEFGFSPWRGKQVDYYRPNWYVRLMSGYKRKALYGEEDISPLGRLMRTIADPYWLEKRHYEERPYPIAGPTGEHLGIFGPLYEATVGRVLKPPVYMHGYTPGGEGEGSFGGDLGELPGEEPVTPYSLAEQIKQQYYTTYEALGLRGFVGSAIKEAFTGEQDIMAQMPILQSSADIESTRRAFWDLSLGGAAGLTEPVRRVIPKRPYSTEYVNPLHNTMPQWLPGSEYLVDFQKGDPMTAVPEGEYRLPGKGYAARYPELEGVDPSEYPLIHRYKILADVAPYSAKFREARAMLERKEPSEEELEIFLTTEEQLKEKFKRQEFRDKSYEETFLGRYGATLTDLAKANPLEQLSPLAPAHKLLPPSDPVQQYREQVFGKEFKLWQNPVDDFIKPFLTTLGHTVGVDAIPEEIEERRTIEEYFDKLKYVKFKRAEKEATENEEQKKANYYRRLWKQTMVGMDVYSAEERKVIALPKRERDFFFEFQKAHPEKREEILEMAPNATRDFYIAGWDAQLLQQLEEQQLDVTEQEEYNLKEEVQNRMRKMRYRREAERETLVQSESLPPEDWSGYSTEVNLDDIKLKYLLQTGRDYHFYDLWDDRVKSLARKPYLEKAIAYLSPFEELIPRDQFAYIYKQLVQAGVQDPKVLTSHGIKSSFNADLEYDNRPELKETLRNLGHIL